MLARPTLIWSSSRDSCTTLHAGVQSVAHETACVSTPIANEHLLLVHRFESRFSSVAILPSPAVLLKGMEGTTVGVWVAHGEGKAHFPKPELRQAVLSNNLAPIRYVDDANVITEVCSAHMLQLKECHEPSFPDMVEE